VQSLSGHTRALRCALTVVLLASATPAHATPPGVIRNTDPEHVCAVRTRRGLKLPKYCPTPTATPAATDTPLATETPTPTATETATDTATPTATATDTPTATATPTVTITRTPQPTTTTTPTPQSTATATPVPSATPTATPTTTHTATPLRTATRTPTPVPTPSATPTGSGACDGSTAPFGLTTRPSATECRLDGNPDDLPQLQVERVFPALSFASPVQLVYPPDGSDRIFVVEQGGTIKVFPNGSPSTATTFLTVTGVNAGGEEGLLGLAFHPRYAQNGYFFVYYSAANPRRSVIARYQVSGNPNVADAASRQIITEIAQPYSNHNGGQLLFGPDDGMLYVGLGDGGSAGDPENRAQNLGELLGKVLRIDVDHADPGLAYAVPSDNPFVGRSGARGEIWTLGMRNPWRLSFDRLTHDLWAGDVGQGTWEEIDLIERGANYGWRRMEGDACYNPSSGCDDGTLTHPLAVYSHSDGCAVVGGFVYRGSRLPELYGSYVYGDYCSGNIWGLRWDGTTATTAKIVANSGLSISAFGEDRDGELYVVSLSGTINRLSRPSTGATATFPRTLTDTGCFADVPARRPAAELIPYDVRSPLWSDGAVKRRFMVVPDGTSIGYTAGGAWNVPVGTILVKEFAYDTRAGDPTSRRALETRFLVRRSGGWQGYTYQWNDAQTEAYLLDDATTKTFPVTDAAGTTTQHTHYFPSRSDCLRCHTTAAGGTLGLQTGQLNRAFDYGATTDNQLRALEHIGLFGGCLPGRPATLPALTDPSDASQPLAARARSYLHANCAHCHLPGGPAPAAIDLRVETPFTSTGLCDGVPQDGDLGVTGARIVKPGAADQSVLWLRMALRGDQQMPPLGTLYVDDAATALVATWIDGLSGCQ
jgi:uncharacterized repeat protein (TIGR03806 family)